MDKSICVTWMGQFVHLHFESPSSLDSNFKLVVSAPMEVTCAVVQYRNKGNSGLVVALRDSSLWYAEINKLVQDHDYKRTKDCMTGDAATESVKSDQDVFADLLKDENTLPDISLNRRNSQTLDKVKYASLKFDHFIVQREGSTILDIAATKSLLCVLFGDNEYRTFIQIFNHGKHKKLELIRELSTELRYESFIIKGASPHRKFLYLVTCQEKSQMTLQHSTIHMERSLFISLFGTEAALTNSVVILLTTSTGLVFYCNLSTCTKETFTGRKFSVCCQLSSAIVIVGTVKLRRGIEGDPSRRDIVASLSAALQGNVGSSTTQEDGWVTALLVCSQSGESYLFVPPGPSTPSVIPWSMTHQVTACLVMGYSLICYTGSDVMVHELKLVVQGDKTCIVSVERKVKSHIDLVQLLPFPCENHSAKVNASTVTGLMKNFVTVPIFVKGKKLEDKERADTKKPSINHSLQSISGISTKLKSSQNKSENLESFLLQLNILSHLKLFSDTDKGDTYNNGTDSALVSSSCCISSNLNGYEPSWSLEVRLCNNSKVFLTDDWSINVSIRELPPTCVTHGADDSFTKSWHNKLYKGLPGQSSLEFQFPLKSVLQVNSFSGIQVCVFLTLRLSKDIPQSSNLPPTQQVQISQYSKDFLHFLRLEDSARGDHKMQMPNWFANEISSLSKLRVAQLEQTQKMTASVIVPDSKSPKSALDMFKFLLQDSSIDLGQVTSPMGQLVSPAGVDIGLAVAGGGEDRDPQDKMAVTIECCDLSTLWIIREAVRERLKQIETSTSHCGTEDRKALQAQLIKLQSVKERLQKQSLKQDVEQESLTHPVTELFKHCQDL